jgi:hypothetical protein
VREEKTMKENFFVLNVSKSFHTTTIIIPIFAHSPRQNPKPCNHKRGLQNYVLDIKTNGHAQRMTDYRWARQVLE